MQQQESSVQQEEVNQEEEHIRDVVADAVTPEGEEGVQPLEVKIVTNAQAVLDNLQKLLKVDNVPRLKRGVAAIINQVEYITRADDDGIEAPPVEEPEPDSMAPGYEYLITELQQIHDTQSSERIHYYIRRLVKGLTEVKTGRINDINLNKWKEYDNILTDSLWLLDRRDASGAHLGWYWGNFVPQIPQQMLLRYSKQGDWVFDPFTGSGTTLIEAKRLGRNAFGVEIQESVAKQARMLVQYEQSSHTSRQHIYVGDCVSFNYEAEMRKIGISSFQLALLHPPYWDILKFSDDGRDLCNAPTLDEYMDLMGSILSITYNMLDRGRYMILVMGDKYHKGELIPLAFHAMQEAIQRGFKLKSIVVKNFEETRGKMNSKELWRYRALVGGFYLFKHEYIMIFRK